MFFETATMEDKRCAWNLKRNKGTTFTLTLTRVSIRYEIVCIIQNLFRTARFTDYFMIQLKGRVSSGPLKRSLI